MLLTGARSYRAGAFHRAAEHLGIEIIPVVNMDAQLAEEWQTDTGVDFERADAAHVVAELARAREVDAVLAVDDSGTLIAAQAASLLGLPHNDPSSAQAARDKVIMRKRMSAGGVPCPWFREFSTDLDPAIVAKEVPYPCVVKPTTLNGSRGVVRANDVTEFVSAVSRLSKILRREFPGVDSSPYLVESFIPGVEVALEGLLDAGQLRVLALFDKPDPLTGPFFEETIYVTPSRLDATVQQSVADCVVLAAEALGLRTGPVHAELRVNEEGPWMLEVAGRSIGGLCSQTLRFGVAASLEELIVRQACGLPIDMAERENSASGVMMIPIPDAGMLRGVDGLDDALAIPDIESIEITAKLNYTITPLPEGESYLGFIFARSNTPENVETALRQAHRCLHFEIVPEFQLQI